MFAQCEGIVMHNIVYPRCCSRCMHDLINHALRLFHGKQAMTIGPGTFNKRANETYAQLSVSEKVKLKTDAEENTEFFSTREILRRGGINI